MQVSEAIALLGHFDQGIRERGMQTLREHGPAAVPALLAALDHPNAAVRGNAALLLGELQAQEALVPLAHKVTDLPPGDDRTLCVRALADLARPDLRDEPGLVEFFARLTRDDDLFVRALACTALGRLGHPRAVAILRRSQGDPEPWVREAAARAMEELAHAPQPGRAKAAPGAPPEPVPQAPRDPESGAAEEPREAASAEGPSAEENLARAHELVNDLYAKDNVTRDLAAEELAGLGEAAVQALCHALRSPVREPPLLALALLGRLRSKSALGPLLSVVANPGTPTDLCTVAIRAIGQICDGTEKAVLDRLIAERPGDVLLRAAIASALGAFRSVRAVRVLLGYLEDADVFVRESAAEALGRAVCPGVPDLPEKLGAALRHESDEGVRLRLLEAVEAAIRAGAVEAAVAARLGGELVGAGTGGARLAGLRLLGAAGVRHPDAARAVASALGDGDPGVRLLACEMAGVVAPTGYAPVVEALGRLVALPDRDQSRAAILALGAVGGPQAASLLRQLRADADSDVADAARAALERLPPEGAEVIPLRPER
jgi:HEAT repeat protein